MEFEFDKEMDSLLRQAAKGEDLFAIENSPTEHIDADEISMFAENALPEKAKPRVMEHLADCDKCRTILSNVIVLNSEDEKTSATIAPAQEVKAETVVASSELTWYQKLFATRNLAFGMGALALIFAVGIGFVVIQNLSNSNSANLAKSPSNSNATIADSASKEEIAKSSNQTPFEDAKVDSSDPNSENNADSKLSETESPSPNDSTVAESKEKAEQPRGRNSRF